ncbi:transcriptional regulator, LysR family [Epibacterium ulvae]|uniref:Transcriptional regulator, LysR family n=1 Tax=Epibacterium ulvae TaxID=1156985 RepID=A0A1G5RAV5_9RHOB|nr:LysR family transcriptional regulator [Epibacterium ulvae]SCZ71205.1 transcriptional regulator, LysR family [Epibacterium ulvae]
MKAKLSFKQLHALEAVARHGSFTQAAREIGVSQPTVSNLIYALEKQYKCRLLDRTGSSITPTPQLAEIRGHIKALISLNDVIDLHLSAEQDLLSGQFHVAYTSSALAMPVLAEFVQAYPALDVSATAMHSLDLQPKLLSGGFDVGFMTTARLPRDLAGFAIADAQIGLWLPKEHPQARHASLSWNVVATLPLIQRQPQSGARNLFETAAQLAQVPLQTRLSLDTVDAVMTLVRQGVGAGVGFAAECPNARDLVFVPIHDPVLAAKHYLVCPKPMRETAMVARFFDTAEANKAETHIASERPRATTG